MELYVGTSGFGYTAWRGKFYPRGLAADGMLPHYATQFPAVEINNSFYRLPAESVANHWATQVPAKFIFAFKAPQQITHFKRLHDCGEALRRFVEVSNAVGKRLGPLLFQLPPNFKKDSERLARFLDLLPKAVRVAFEFRHPSWFEPDIYELLRRHAAALCIAEDELVTPFEATATFGYLRLRRLDYSPDELAERARQITAQKWQEAFVFFKHEDQALGVELARRFQQLTAAPDAAATPAKHPVTKPKPKSALRRRKS